MSAKSTPMRSSVPDAAAGSPEFIAVPVPVGFSKRVPRAAQRREPSSTGEGRSTAWQCTLMTPLSLPASHAAKAVRYPLLHAQEGWSPGVVTSSIQVAGLMPVLMGGTFAMAEK